MYRKWAFVLVAIISAHSGASSSFAGDDSSPTFNSAPSKVAPRDELGVSDKLKISFFGNPDLSGEVIIQSDGTIILPMLGTFQASGKTVAELTKSISERFSQDRSKVSGNVVVSVVEWRPLYVMGDVRKAGSYPFSPGMTVMHAISIAGGFTQLANADPGTFINVAQNSSRMLEIQEQTKHQIVRRASLVAEKNGQNTIKLPAEVVSIIDKQSIQGLIAQETQTLGLRQKALQDEIEMRTHQLNLTRQEINDYANQVVTVDNELKLKRTHLSELNDLLAKGVAKRPDILISESYIATLESNRRELCALMARAQRDLVQLEQSVVDIPRRRQIQIDEELNSLDEKIQANVALYEAARQIVEQFGGLDTDVRAASAEPPKRYLQIMRKSNAGQIFVAADYESIVKPGDVVVVGKKIGHPAELLASWTSGSSPDR